MTAEHEPAPRFTIEEMAVEDIDEATRMRLESWVDTYVNEEHDITEEWIRNYFAEKLTDEGRQQRYDRFTSGKESGNFNAWVARDDKGIIIGSTTPFIDPEGRQHVGSIYVDKEWHGTGVGTQLMQKVVDWFDPDKPIELGVVTYNERAKAFYRKWGFEEIENSEHLYIDKIPEVRMVRKASNEI